jgi:hypothetical protein
VLKSSQKVWLLFLIEKNLPKENNWPIGENSANLVTLLPQLVSSLPFNWARFTSETTVLKK